jgi:hypothetical protein
MTPTDGAIGGLSCEFGSAGHGSGRPCPNGRCSSLVTYRPLLDNITLVQLSISEKEAAVLLTMSENVRTSVSNGSGRSPSGVELTSPPFPTTASGRWISEPGLATPRRCQASGGRAPAARRRLVPRALP